MTKKKRGTTMRAVLEVFRPNRASSKKITTILFGFWVATALLFWIFGPSKIVPRPGDVFSSFGPLFRDGLMVEVMSSVKTNLEAILIGTVFSLVLSYLTVSAIARPLAWGISKGRFLGLIGLTFLFTLFTGGGHNLKVALLVFGYSVFFITSMAQIVEEIPKDEYDHARTLRMGEWRVVWEVVVLGKLDLAFEVLRQNAAIGWMMLTMVEGIVRSEGGIGAMLLAENKHFKLEAVFAIQLTILVIGLLQDYFIGVFRNVACPYAKLTLDRR